MGRLLFQKFLAIAGIFFLMGCLKESEPIVIPPGDIIEYSNSGFVGMSGDFYSMHLQSLKSNSNELFDIEELLPDGAKNQIFTGRFLVPKDKGNSEIYVIRVRLVKESIEFFAIALPGEIVKPDYVTTIVTNILINYPHRRLSEYSANNLVALHELVRSAIELLNAETVFPEEFNAAQRMRYYENHMATHPGFISYLDKEMDVEFDLDSNLRPVSEPYPFARNNRPPTIDEINSTSPSVIVYAPEKNETIVKGIGRDPDNDSLIYKWFYEGKQVSTLARQYSWTPDFHESRPEPYSLRLQISDGSKPIDINWVVQVTDLNRGPVVTHNCEKDITEWQEWSCEISGVDFDGDPVQWRLSDKFSKAQARLNDTLTNPVSRLVEISSAEKVRIRFTPNNADAKLRSSYLELIAIDPKGGQTNVAFQLNVADINVAPRLVPDPIDPTKLYKPMILDFDSAREWDSCSDSDPDGNRAYRFMIEVEDPDNLPAAAPRGQAALDRDLIERPRFSGSLREQVQVISEAQGCPLADGLRNFTCFEWRPSDNRKSGVLSVVLRDDHGGSSEPIELTLNAYDRNQRPCLQMTPSTSALLDETRTSTQFSASATDADLVTAPPYIEIVGDPYGSAEFPPEMIPFMRSCADKHLIFKKSFLESSLRYREQPAAGAGQSAMCYQARYLSGSSGFLRWTRSSSHPSNVVVPQGTVIQTVPTGGNTKRMQFETMVDIIIEPNDEIIHVPIRAINRTANPGTVVKVFTSVPTGFSVTNPAPLTRIGSVRWTRTNTSTIQILPAGTIIGTDDTAGSQTIKFKTVKVLSFAIGEATKDVNVGLEEVVADMTDAFTWGSTAPSGPAITISVPASSAGSPTKVVGSPEFSLPPYRGRGITNSGTNRDRFCWYTRALDATVSATGTVTQVLGPLASSINSTNASALGLSGTLNLTRTNTSLALVVPSGTTFSTLNNTQYVTTSDVNFGAGVASISVLVIRKGHESPIEPVRTGEVTAITGPLSSQIQVTNRYGIGSSGWVEFFRTSEVGVVSIPAGTEVRSVSHSFLTTSPATLVDGSSRIEVAVTRLTQPSPQSCVGFRDYNHMPSLLGVSQTSVIEGQTLLGFELQATDNLLNPSEPKDPNDHFLFQNVLGDGSPIPVSRIPVGPYLFCRSPGDNPSNINSPACQPCLNNDIDIFASGNCYFRFKPDREDTAESYSFNIVLNDDSAAPDGYVYPAGSNKRSNVMIVNVSEINDPPTHTDLDWNIHVALGGIQTNPIPLGGFVEGTSGSYPIYASDVDKSTVLKNLTFSLHGQVWDFETNQWKARPTSMQVRVIGPQPPPDPIWGSRYKGELVWTPTDEEAKNFASINGFAVGIYVNDGAPSQTLAWYRVSVVNLNNNPRITLATNNGWSVSDVTLTVEADKFIDWQGIYIDDADFGSVGSPVNFSTQLSPCIDSAVQTCAAPTDNWPEEVLNFEDPYDYNVSQTSCRLGSGVRVDRAKPFLSLVSNMGVQTVNGQNVRRYRYGAQWCPQRSHIGVHTALLNASDNGDKNRLNEALPAVTVSSPWTLNVVSDIFFESPLMDAFGQPLHYMNQSLAQVASTPFRYRVLLNNSRQNSISWSIGFANAGEPQWANRVCSSLCPTSSSTAICAVPGQQNRICIVPIGGGKKEAEIRWMPSLADVSTSDPLSRPVIRVTARDTVKNKTVVSDFPLWIQSPLAGPEYAPTIDSIDPLGVDIPMREREKKTFSVVASDQNMNDVLHYRWFVNGALKSDEGPSFVYQPAATDGFVDGDGSGPLKFGQHRVLVEVTDGNNVTSHSWVVTVKNNIPAPVYAYSTGGNSVGFDIWDLIARRWSKSRSGISNLVISHEQAVPLTVRVGSTDRFLNHYFLTGSYTRDSQPRRFLMNIKMDTGVLKNLNTDRYNLTELPWPAGADSGRLTGRSISNSAFDILITPLTSIEDPYSSTQTGLKLGSGLNLSSLSGFSASYGCTGSCVTHLYSGPYQSGVRRSAFLDKSQFHYFYASDIRDQAIWFTNGVATPFLSLTGSERIYDVAVNSNNDRLYVSIRDVVSRVYQIKVFSVAGVSGGSPPTLVTTLPIFDGVNIDNRLGDLLVVPEHEAVYGYLEGSGGVVRLVDDGTTPTAADLTFIGVSAIGGSSAATPESGRKFTFNPITQVIFGVSKDASQVYAIDVTKNPDGSFVDSVGVGASPVGLDSIFTFPNDGLTIGTVKSNPNSNVVGRVYWIQ